MLIFVTMMIYVTFVPAVNDDGLESTFTRMKKKKKPVSVFCLVPPKFKLVF